MSRRVTPSERLRAEVDQVFAGDADLATMVEQVAQLGARRLLQRHGYRERVNGSTRIVGRQLVRRSQRRSMSSSQ